MKDAAALIFGFNKFAIEIANNVTEKYDKVYMFSLNKEDEQNEEYKVSHFDLSEHWEDLSDNYDMENSLAFCVLDDDAENVFLTISLRASFEELPIIAIAKDKQSVSKLTMAGVNKVIPLVDTTADIITNMIEKPISTKILHGILYEKSNLKIVQIKVENEDYFHGEYPADIDWSRYKGIVVLSVMHEDMSSEFIYSSKSKHHVIRNGDIFVVVGFEADIVEFEKLIGSRTNVNWGHRRR
jgi:Trk K+ transport system NAD-binding subunit